MNNISHSVKFEKKLNALIDLALKEDIGECDHTTFATVPAKTQAEGKLLIKDNGVIAGVEMAQYIFSRIDDFMLRQTRHDIGMSLSKPQITMDVKKKDGEKVKKGDIVFTVKGPARSLLMTERLILNCMQRMSGIATQAHELTALCKGTKAKVIDTRKTTPGIRLLEKWAVVIGGATNYRWGLYDMILIKDNHIECAGGVKKAIDATHVYLKKNRKKLGIVIEADSMQQVKEVLAVGGVNRILLDNFSLKEIAKAVKLINGKYKTEASGGITKKNIREYAKTGVDYISVGALTHSVKSLDMSLKIFPNV
ncbi:MAG TPA: carboxylating nicotinate-nucleotide diphosphorylase [Bacteroidia bacterium]|jgi:nicotinate-nucleotide pyrophosphorylase (carboxylating)|nr:carboxylating nicotinate-nucleotide diphosphorylase [Bacteroidia bacterium]